MKLTVDKEFTVFDKAPGRQWIIVLTNGRIYSYILNNRIYPEEVTMGDRLTPSAKMFVLEYEAWEYARMHKLDKNFKVEVVNFVEEMKHLIRLRLWKKMVNEPYVRITVENSLGEKLYIRYDERTGRLFPDKDWRGAFMQTLSKAEVVINAISSQMQDKYKNYKTEEL